MQSPALSPTSNELTSYRLSCKHCYDRKIRCDRRSLLQSCSRCTRAGRECVNERRIEQASANLCSRADEALRRLDQLEKDLHSSAARRSGNSQPVSPTSAPRPQVPANFPVFTIRGITTNSKMEDLSSIDYSGTPQCIPFPGQKSHQNGNTTPQQHHTQQHYADHNQQGYGHQPQPAGNAQYYQGGPGHQPQDGSFGHGHGYGDQHE